VAEAARRSDCELQPVAELYFLLSHQLSLPWFSEQLAQLQTDSFWQVMARQSHMDDLESQLLSLTISLMKSQGSNQSAQAIFSTWEQQQSLLIKRWDLMVKELRLASKIDFAVISVALRELLDLSQATQHCAVIV
jgi:glutamate dehydrogenase